MVLVGCVGGDAGTDQGSNTSQVQVSWDGVDVAAAQREVKQKHKMSGIELVMTAYTQKIDSKSMAQL
jgi:hypothetical protein